MSRSGLPPSLSHRASPVREASLAAAVASPENLAAQSLSPNGPRPNGPRPNGPSMSDIGYTNPSPNHRASPVRDPRGASRAAAVASPASLAALSPSPNGLRRSGPHPNGERLSMMDGVSLCGASLSLSHRASLAKDPREASRDVAVASPESQAAQSLSPNGPHLAGVSPSHGVHLHGPNPNLSHRASLARDPKVPREASRVAAVASPASLAALSLSPSGPRLSGEHGRRLSMMDGVSLSGLSLSHQESLARDPREASRDVAVVSPASQAAQSLSPNGPRPNGPRPNGPSMSDIGYTNPNPNHRASLAKDLREASRAAAVASQASLAALNPSPNGPRRSGPHLSGPHLSGPRQSGPRGLSLSLSHRASLARDQSQGGELDQ